MLHSCLELLAKWWRRLGMMPVCLAMFWVTYYSLFGQPAPNPPRASYTSTPDHLENMSDFLLAPSAQEQWDITQHKQECRRQHVSPLKVTVSHHLKGMRWSSAMLCHHMGCPTYVKTNHARSNCRKLCSSKDTVHYQSLESTYILHNLNWTHRFTRDLHFRCECSPMRRCWGAMLWAQMKQGEQEKHKGCLPASFRCEAHVFIHIYMLT